MLHIRNILHDSANSLWLDLASSLEAMLKYSSFQTMAGRMVEIINGAMDTQLDQIFGFCVDPNQNVTGVTDWERKHHQLSRNCLDHKSAAALNRFMNLAEGDRLLASMWPVVELTIIWLVDQGGAIYFAIEEVVKPDDVLARVYPAEDYDGNENVHRYPLQKSLTLWPGHDGRKLGHPALVHGSPARIGGEIFFDAGEGAGEWLIWNKSGRFGSNLGRNLEQLTNVAKQFGNYGVKLRPVLFVGRKVT